MQKLQAIIRTPCPEKWDKMTPNEQGRHCEKCALTVIDFTQMEEEEIHKTLQARAGQRTCGRMKSKPVSYSLSELTIYSHKHPTPWKFPRSLYTLSLASMLLASCDGLPGKRNIGEIGQVETSGKVEQVDSLFRENTLDSIYQNPLFSPIDTVVQDTTHCVKKPKPPIPPYDPLYPEPIEMGDVIVDPISEEEPPIGKMVIPTLGEMAIDVDTPYFAPTMPQFPGGEDSMMAFIQRNIRFPKEGLAQEIQGRVIVRFVVSTEGKIMNARVVKSIPNAPYFDEEALRVFSIMPDWSPAQNYDGKVMPIHMALPIRFKLD